MDFYMLKYREQWAPERKVKTPEGEVIVTVPDDDYEGDEEEALRGASRDIQLIPH
jgi:hypothetical protein